MGTTQLDPEITVIADASGPISLGGIMGGESTGCTAATTDVLLEIALFDPRRTALNGRRLAIESDARTRFERGVDPAMVLPGMEHATRLILELCGGEAGAPIRDTRFARAGAEETGTPDRRRALRARLVRGTRMCVGFLRARRSARGPYEPVRLGPQSVGLCDGSAEDDGPQGPDEGPDERPGESGGSAASSREAERESRVAPRDSAGSLDHLLRPQ